MRWGNPLGRCHSSLATKVCRAAFAEDVPHSTSRLAFTSMVGNSNQGIGGWRLELRIRSKANPRRVWSSALTSDPIGFPFVGTRIPRNLPSLDPNPQSWRRRADVNQRMRQDPVNYHCLRVAGGIIEELLCRLLMNLEN